MRISGWSSDVCSSDLLWYTKTEGHMARFAVGHSRELAARHYADLPSPRPLHEPAVADAFCAAVAAAMPTVLPPTAEHALRTAPSQALPPLPLAPRAPELAAAQHDWLRSCPA